MLLLILYRQMSLISAALDSLKIICFKRYQVFSLWRPEDREMLQIQYELFETKGQHSSIQRSR